MALVEFKSWFCSLAQEEFIDFCSWSLFQRKGKLFNQREKKEENDRESKK